MLANPQLRTAEGMAAQASFGERVPVPVTTFSPIATGGVQQQPITSFNYENIGVNIDITPRTHHDDEVSLAVKIEVSSISGTGFGGLPTFGNRAINTVIRLKDGETNMLAGLIRDDERTSLAGVPGLSDLPLVGRLFAYNHKETTATDIILTLTPHIVRVLDLTAEDLAAVPGRPRRRPVVGVTAAAAVRSRPSSRRGRRSAEPGDAARRRSCPAPTSGHTSRQRRATSQPPATRPAAAAVPKLAVSHARRQSCRTMSTFAADVCAQALQPLHEWL